MSATGFILRKKKAEALKNTSVTEKVAEVKSVSTVEVKTETVESVKAEAEENVKPTVKRGRIKKEN